MSLATRRLIQTIARRNRATHGAGRQGRFVCIGKDALAYTSPGSGVLTTSAIDEENCGVTFVITSSKQDRDGDVIQPRGLNLEMWKRSPVWFWNHQQNPYPIGTGRHPKTGQVNVIVTESQVIATCYFDQADPEAMKIYGKILRGFISACSIGFIPLVMNRLRDKANRDRMAQPAGYDVEQAEVVEVSITGVGSNRDAFVVGRSFGSASAIRSFGAKAMSKNRVRDLPNKPKITKAAEPDKKPDEKPSDKPAVDEKSSAADVQHVALSKGQFPEQADAMSWADKQGLSTDDVRETDTDWEFHQFPEEELVPDSGNFTDLADGVKAFAGQRVTEPASDLMPEAGKDGAGAAEGTGSDGGALVEEDEAPLKPSARFAMDAIQHVTEELGLQEHADLVPLLEDFLEEMKGFADNAHPDLDLYEKPATNSEDDTETEETDSETDKPDKKKKAYVPYALRRSLQTKGLPRTIARAIKAAAEYLDSLGANQKSFQVLKAGASYHAAELRRLASEPEADTEAVVLSLKNDLALAQKAEADYTKKSRAVLGR